FDDVLGVADAIGEAAGVKARSQTGAGQRLDAATQVAEVNRAVADDRLSMRVQELHAVVVLEAAVAVPIPLGRVILESQQALVVCDGGQGAVRTYRYVGQAGGPVAAESTTSEGVYTQIDMLLEERPASVAAAAARPRGAVVGACRRRASQSSVRINAIAEV